MNNYSQASIDTVEKYLKAMKPLIAGWEADFGKEMMTKGKAWLNNDLERGCGMGDRRG